MENKSLNRDEVNRNYERTLTLLRSTKPEAADIMLTMLNDSILKRYGDSKQAIDISKFSKLSSEKNDNDNINIPNKKSKLKKIKKEKYTICKNEKKLNEQSSDVNIQDPHQKMNYKPNQFNDKTSKHNKSKAKITEDDESSLRCKDSCYEKANVSSDEYEEKLTNNNISQTIKTFNNRTKPSLISKQNENSENSIGIQESKIHDIQNTEYIQTKRENELSDMLASVKKAQPRQKSIAKVRSHKKPPLHELSSRQRIQAVLEKGINNK